MSKLFTSILLLILFFSISAADCHAAQPTASDAIIAAEKFLETIDKNEFSLAWDQTGVINQSYSEHPDWFKKLLAVRPRLGQVINRSLDKVSHHDSWVGLPDGDYLRVSFQTAFHNKADSLETVVLIKEQGRWLVSSYHLR